MAGTVYDEVEARSRVYRERIAGRMRRGADAVRSLQSAALAADIGLRRIQIRSRPTSM